MRLQSVTIPALTISGWYDLFLLNDLYHYDPHNPVPTRGGKNIDPKQQGNPGPFDQREIEDERER
ncbi:hypothetical protein KDW_57950 [Dictyobacter vulcani]|uniref:Uncharacterized protein n=1 Tax=Dictyobacter vulcani TaxID=2607529 RepID=A0A5J4KVV6_9CHLR|nr:hypothetical protein [Dictyobacter vulcani]GER91633.1 hypothetical protein KDW_57950 [Dictyobacter vulcani]